MKLICFFIVLNINSIFSHGNDISCRPHDHNGRAREKTVKLSDLELSVYLNEKEGAVEGHANYKFEYFRKEIDTLFLDAIQFEVRSILLNKNKVDYKTDSAGITIYLPKDKSNKNRLEIFYKCFPKRGMYFLNWNNNNSVAKKQIWTQGQGIDNRHWIPGFDDVANLLTTKLHIRFNRKYPVISNGNLIKKTLNSDSVTQTWTYEMTKPHALYLLMIAAGDYRVKKLKSASGIILEQYYYPEFEKHFDATYTKSAEMMDWFENEIGIPYSWGKVYRNVPTQDFLFGAMENTTSTIFTDSYHPDTRGALNRPYVSINAHELAHQWFGDLITERNPTHHWLHESFATHYSKWFMLSAYGTETYDWIRKGERDAAFNASLYNDFPVAHSQGGSARHYPKGSYVLDMMRWELGNENYRKVIQNYLNKYKHSNVESNNLYESIYEVVGRNIDWFFDQWIYKGGEPKIQVSYTKNNNKLVLTLLQLHKKNEVIKAFRLPLDVHILNENQNEIIHSVIFDKDSQTFEFEITDAFKMLTIDPNAKLLRKISYDSELKTEFDILKYSKYPMARFEALERLRNIDLNNKINEYDELNKTENQRIVKVELLQQLKNAENSEKVTEMLLKGINDSDHHVREAAIRSISYINEPIKAALKKSLNDSSYFNIEYAFQQYIKFFPKEKEFALSQIENLQGLNHNLEIVYHGEMLQIFKENKESQKHKEALIRLKELASANYEFRTRLKSFEYLIALNQMNEEIIHSLIQGSLHFHYGLSGRCREYLEYAKRTVPAFFEKAFSTYIFENEKQKNDLLKKL